jgi:Rps23 Pro-64 3,4-dihydroxylase Tpa1-like proline 4-hydroxylase
MRETPNATGTWELSISPNVLSLALHSSRQQHKLFSVLSPEDACVDVDVSRKTINNSYE